MFYKAQHKGFTLVELMVVIGIIVLILGVLMASFLDARKNGRDKNRVSALAQIEFALSAYYDVNNNYPDSDDLEPVSGLGLDSYWTGTITDPLYDNGNNGFDYLYNSSFVCDSAKGDRYTIIFAQTLEMGDKNNLASVCPDLAIDYEDAYVVIIAGPLSEGGGFNEQSSSDEEGWWALDENQTLQPPPVGVLDAGDGI